MLVSMLIIFFAKEFPGILMKVYEATSKCSIGKIDNLMRSISTSPFRSFIMVCNKLVNDSEMPLNKFMSNDS